MNNNNILTLSCKWYIKKLPHYFDSLVLHKSFFVNNYLYLYYICSILNIVKKAFYFLYKVFNSKKLLATYVRLQFIRIVLLLF